MGAQGIYLSPNSWKRALQPRKQDAEEERAAQAMASESSCSLIWRKGLWNRAYLVCTRRSRAALIQGQLFREAAAVSPLQPVLTAAGMGALAGCRSGHRTRRSGPPMPALCRTAEELQPVVVWRDAGVKVHIRGGEGDIITKREHTTEKEGRMAVRDLLVN